MYDEALKNTPNDDNTKFQIGCEHANKFVQLNKDKIDLEAHSLTIGQQNERTLRCTTVLQLLLLNHTDVILKQGTTRYASLLQQYRASDTLASNVEKILQDDASLLPNTLLRKS